MKKTIFGLDIDGVIRDICHKSLELYNRCFDDNMTFIDWKEYNVDRQFPKIRETLNVSASTWLFGWHGTELFRMGDTIGNPSGLVDRLKTFGDVVIVSDQKSKINKTDTLDWLDAHDVKYDGICFVNEKSLIHVDYLIDDNPIYLVNSNCEHAVLINAPYNKNMVFSGVKSKKTYDRFDSLEDFVNHLENENAKKKE